MNRYFRVSFALTLVIFWVACTALSAGTLDITQVDLFSLKGWDSNRVSVDGLRLRMNLTNASQTLSTGGLALFDSAARTTCGVTSLSCYVASRATDGGTVIISLSGDARVASIYVGVPEDPATLPSTIAGRFKGMTRRFFFHYSDELRLKLLGPPDRVKKSPTTDAMQGQMYYYDRLGLIVGTSRSLMRGMKTPTPPELSGIEFVAPKALRSASP